MLYAITSPKFKAIGEFSIVLVTMIDFSPYWLEYLGSPSFVPPGSMASFRLCRILGFRAHIVIMLLNFCRSGVPRPSSKTSSYLKASKYFMGLYSEDSAGFIQSLNHSLNHDSKLGVS